MALKEKFNALLAKGRTKTLRKMIKEDFIEYRDDLKDFLQDFEVAARNEEEGDILKNEGFEGKETVASIKSTLKDLRDRVKAEKHRRTLKGRLGIKKPLTKEEKAAKKKEAEAEKATEIARIQTVLAAVEEKKKEIARERAEAAQKTYGDPNKTATQARGILADAVDEFRHAFTPPLLPEEIEELQRKQDGLDALNAVRDMHELQGEQGKVILDKVGCFLKGTVSVIGEFAEETTGGVLKAVTLFLGWPIVLPVKLLNTAFAGAKYAFCFVDGVFGFFDKGLDGLFPKLYRNADGSIKFSGANVLKGIPHVLIRGPILLVRGVCQGAAIGCRFLEKHIDADRWLKKSPVTAGFVLGGVGTILLIGIVVASVFTLGIPIAALAGGLVAASIGAAIYGYFKGKAKKDEVVSLEMSPLESAQLKKYEHTYQHRKGLATSPEDREKLEQDRDNKDYHKDLEGSLREATGRFRKPSADSLPVSDSSRGFSPLHSQHTGGASEPQHSQDPKKPSGKLKQD